ncbi:hypothetical protein NPD5_293 [Clostridium sporogenes]|uniref:Uncharacterized protein n=1 Tax=Clostridium sporogenes TaxID=1509 RepID=A0A1J1CUL7_CLOSG|nr:hypothetical protein [Clostridium sporogenes]APF26301.1 hypothetical protein NPD7_1280 [Clostridium sporogenes]APH14180.1 hypothetical protein NPD5_293 [Clostridium sporogenes]
MKEWCLQHPWMTFFIIIFSIGIISKNINLILGGKKDDVKNLKNKGVMEMSDNKTNTTSKQSGISKNKPSETKTSYNERGSQSVPPSSTSAPPLPPKQK